MIDLQRRLGSAGTAVLIPVSGLAAVLLVLLSREMSPDGWYAMLGGDVIVHHGLPSHDWLTVWGHGRRWIDQQWLAQLVFYGLYALGGLRLALLANALVVVSSFGVAVAGARARGATTSAVLLVAVPGAVAVGLSSYALRPQTLALPLFVVIVRLLVDDARRPSRRAFLVVPVLALWANLHGSVTLGALVVLLAVACSVWKARATALRGAALGASAILAVFASPYAPQLPDYYRAVLFNGDFAQYVPDWMPTALSGTTLAFFVLAVGALFVIGRAPTSLTLFERTLILVLLVLSIQATRGITWFSLAALIILPTAIRVPLRSLSATVARAVAAVGLAAAVVAGAVAVARPAHWFDSSYPVSVAAATRSAAGSGGRVFANGAYSDWLLFKEPSLRGRVAYDARFELLPDGRLADAAAVSIGRWDTSRILQPFDVVVMRPAETELRDALLRTGNWRPVAAHADVAVFRRTRA